MYIKPIFKRHKSNGAAATEYRLVESYRCDNGVRHHTILHLGRLHELPDVEQKRALSIRLNDLVKQSYTGIQSLFIPEQAVETLAQRFFVQIQEQQRLDIASGKDIQPIDTESVKNKDIREAGTEWLCLQALQQLGIKDFLLSKGWSDAHCSLALTHIISRAAYPASELRTAAWIRENSAVCELTGYPCQAITKDKLYHISHQLFSIKNELEKHLSTTTNELFDLDDKIIIYDLTNTYFEGSMHTSKVAQYGRSKEKRSDAKLVVLAVIVNTEGFLKYSQIFEGNMTDSKTLVQIIDTLCKQTSHKKDKPIVVIDAGIATEDNLKLLKTKGYEYMCVARSGLKKYKVDAGANPVVVQDNKEQPIELRTVQMPDSSDTWIEVKSPAKAAKETGMNSLFAQRFEHGLEQIKQSLCKKSGIKKQQKVAERIGRLKQKYSSTHKHYNINIIADDKGTVTDIEWQQKPRQNKEGIYLLRTTLHKNNEATQWKVYNVIREIEATFRVLKTDLDLRPIYHKTDAAAMAHLHLGLLAYWAVNTIRYQLKAKGIKNEWRDIVRTMNTQKIVTTTMKNQWEQHIQIRQCSEPAQPVSHIYELMGYKPKPFSRKKYVVPPAEIKKNETQQNQYPKHE